MAPRDVLAEALGLEEELAVAHAVRLRVLDVDRREALPIVPVDSSAARMPLPGAAMALAVAMSCVFVGAGEGRHCNLRGYFGGMRVRGRALADGRGRRLGVPLRRGGDSMHAKQRARRRAASQLSF